MTLLLEQTFTLSTLSQMAQTFYAIAQPYTVWALSGQLGAGKTTFTSAVCSLLGVEDAVSSPTFSIINHYEYTDATGITKQLFHSDWYRLADEEEAINAGVEDMLHTGNNLCIVEWWERAPELLPPNTLFVALEVIDEETRKIKCMING
ncbi:tRNA (adenosine(37)-N6)-threonylcarbamoyltransferase complex ATPase subunit type 1 TsaE [Taibaiella sp. KBW10]|uniref:tRNA (adenosine(37)-N6)-threonylcarbamoyltransferase complex ATPase subunit type 1 TsaE n=1 Tax=Taibaiella sp. KBW10 TaxID=2153357 RepID=UPI000F5AEEF5|nr:tRNA (adenosine(37)-N6)-threonylcarbamoyltransferase complex ATPase subunit type 1 TsaE [Taibaiella sp. KBW10]RQO32043.1 tRNA (adenosine(37)-N6)-threonylcarbamoyltransferase complex ATPase subunit type 1 TsaE [Taibaiella sp. KBW10]